MTGDKKNKIDWSKGRHREMLEWQRRQMWKEDDIERHAGWMDLRPGMVAVDIGCGLAFLGYTYWKYFGKGGRYIGIDLSSELLKDASEAAKSWAVEGEVNFIAADAYNLPFKDNFADWVMCQTLMIHLEQPRSALSEMKRITKPGGLITCIEPDNLSPTLVRACSSLPEYDLETQLLLYKVNLIGAKGRIKLGLGDLGVAPFIPHLLSELKLEDIDIRVRDRVPFVEPPYKLSEQQRTIENMKRYLLNDESFKNQAEESRKQFLAGGGDPNEFDRVLELGDKQRKTQMKQIENKEFFICRAYPVYIIKARKSRQFC